MIFTFAFIYRLALMLSSTYPPGADIGLHNSVIYSITGSGSVDLFYNPYHMGGGLSLTFPGYHLFTANIILMTGMPEYVAQAAVASLFSALIVLAAFLITRSVWSEPAAFVVAFLAAISRFDLEMLLWAGYPNVITLLLIPTTLYLCLQRNRFSLKPFLVSTSILAGSIFLTHSLSAALYVGITVLIALFVLIKPDVFATTRKTALYWLLPIFFGAILFFPFLIQAVPAYLQNSSSLADSTSSTAIKLATIATQRLPLELVLPLFGILPGLLLFSKKYHGRFFALPTFLLMMWLCVPLIFSQSYLVGFAIDYNRFLYFLLLPMIIFVGVLIEYGSRFFAQKLSIQNSAINQAQKNINDANTKLARFFGAPKQKNIYTVFILFFLLFSFLALPIFMGPVYEGGITIQRFYQTMDSKLMEAIQWAKTNTPADSVFVADALYGWWFGGFAQRPTYSAVDPQYLSINEEYNKTLLARNLLDTDYLLDNDLIQVREDGGYVVRHNPQILAKLNWTYFPSTFFVFAANETSIEYQINGMDYNVTVDSLAVRDMQMLTQPQQVTIAVSRDNQHFNYTQLTTVYEGSQWVNLTTTIDSTLSGFSLNEMNILVQTKDEIKNSGDARTIGVFDRAMKVFGQVIFTDGNPTSPIKPEVISVYNNETKHSVNQTRIPLRYSFYGEKTMASIGLSASAYSVTNDNEKYKDDAFLVEQMTINMESYQTMGVSKGWEQIFNYKTELQHYNVSYVAYRAYRDSIRQSGDPEIFPKFLKDSSFSLVFFSNQTNAEVINEIAIFKVHGNFLK